MVIPETSWAGGVNGTLPGDRIDRNRTVTRMTWSNRTIQGKSIAMLLLAAHFSSLTVSPALAFELFGIRLWGEDKKEDPDIIDPKTYTVEVTTTGDRKNADGTRSEERRVGKGGRLRMATAPK